MRPDIDAIEKRAEAVSGAEKYITAYIEYNTRHDRWLAEQWVRWQTERQDIPAMIEYIRRLEALHSMALGLFQMESVTPAMVEMARDKYLAALEEE